MIKQRYKVIRIYENDKNLIDSHCSEFLETHAVAVHELVELAITTGYPKRIG